MTAAPEWLALLRQAKDEHGSINAVAALLGYSRTAVSLALGGKYPNTEQLAQRVMERLGGLHCPHLDERISQAACIDYRGRPHPTSSQAAAAHWRACRSCPKRGTST